MNQEELWIIFPFSGIKTTLKDPSYPGLVLLKTADNPKGMMINPMILKVPAVNKLGSIKYISIKSIDVERHLDKLCTRLGIKNAERICNNTRWPVFVTNEIEGISICYSATLFEPDRQSIINLESDVERCMLAKLDKLDDCELEQNWRDGFLTPFLEHVQSKLSEVKEANK
jgi:hypothetical protein